MIAQLLVLIVFPALLLAAAGWDLASYTIPNFLPVGLIAAFVLFALVVHMPVALLGWHLLAGGVALAVCFTLLRLAISAAAMRNCSPVRR